MITAQTQVHLSRLVDLFTDDLSDNLLGVYLHGSLAMGCFNPLKSDIDLLVVIKENCSDEHKKRLARKVVVFHNTIEHGLELSVVLESSLQSIVYPTPCVFHYSDYHREHYRREEDYLCSDYEDADLASQIAVAYHRGITLHGKPLTELYPPVPRQHYLASIHYDVRNADEEIVNNPMYIILNLCRVLLYIRDGRISSKREGGEWGVHNLPREYQELVQSYLNEYNGVKDEKQHDQVLLADFADFMLHEINKQLI